MGNLKISESEYSNIIDLYKQGWSQSQIADKYNVDRHVIKTIFKQCGVSRKDKPCRFSQEEIEHIRDMYESGKTVLEISSLYNISDESMRRWFNIWGIQRRHTKYTFDEHYFDVIDDQNKAYIIGLLYSDGYHNVKKSTISLTLQKEDKHILESISALLHSDRPLRFVNNSVKNDNWSDCYQLCFTSHHMSNVLESYGVVASKSLVITFPQWLDKSLYSHFIRGIFDGDGNISKGKNKYNMSIVSTENFCQSIQEILDKELGIESHIYISSTPDKPTRTLMITKKHLNKIFFDWIYEDANLYLERKYDVYRSKYCHENIDNALISVAN